MSNAQKELQQYYENETIYQRSKQANHTVDLLRSAASRINRAAREVKQLTGETYSYNDISYPQEVKDLDDVTVDGANALTVSQTPLTNRIQRVHTGLLVGENPDLATADGATVFTSIENNKTARGEIKKLIEETARVMDDLMVALITAKDRKIKEDYPEGDELEIGNHSGLDTDLLMTRIALAGKPPQSVFTRLGDNTGRSTGYIEDKSERFLNSEHIGGGLAGVRNAYGGTQVEHMEIGLAVEQSRHPS